MVSIIIPCFNVEKTIYQVLTSVMHQTYKSFEIILIDDGSIDETKQSIKAFFRKNPKIEWRYIYQVNAGPSKARNKGIQEARGKYIAFLDADDMWHPQKLEIVLLTMEKYNLSILGHGFHLNRNFDKIFDTTNLQQSLMQKTFWNLLLKNFAVTPSVVVTRESCLLFDESMRYMEDHELWLRMSVFNKVYFLDIPLVVLGRKPLSIGGLSANKIAMRIGEIKVYFKIMKYKKWLCLLVPFLIIFSLCKHFRLIIKR